MLTRTVYIIDNYASGNTASKIGHRRYKYKTRQKPSSQHTCTATCSQKLSGPARGGPRSSTAPAHAPAASALSRGSTKSSYSLSFHKIEAARAGASSLSDLVFRGLEGVEVSR